MTLLSTMGVIDPETSFDQVANVGIKDGRIAKITTKKISGKETINAKGLNATALCAPAIDAHFNNQGYNLVHELLVMKRLKKEPARTVLVFDMHPQFILAAYRVYSLIQERLTPSLTQTERGKNGVFQITSNPRKPNQPVFIKRIDRSLGNKVLDIQRNRKNRG